MKNERGMTSEMMKLILAVLVLALLFFGAIKLYQSVLGDTELKSAKNILEKVEAKAEALSEGQNTTMTLLGFDSEQHWIIAGWNKDDPAAPEKCFISSCVCVCDGKDTWYFYPKNPAQPLDCQRRGVCSRVEEDRVIIESIVLAEPDAVDFAEAIGMDPAKAKVNYIVVGNTFSELKFQKTKDSEGKTILVIKNE